MPYSATRMHFGSSMHLEHLLKLTYAGPCALLMPFRAWRFLGMLVSMGIPTEHWLLSQTGEPDGKCPTMIFILTNDTYFLNESSNSNASVTSLACPFCRLWVCMYATRNLEGYLSTWQESILSSLTGGTGPPFAK